ncbi:MAG: prepilin-type N-terminal cleavage/methylation domain-containing protein [Planctomycetota bacterium]|nr:MAG: prepilin-type N-terminal cleavage/methylation domain-containing protein [Planctomycetota bacterium]
MKRRAGFTLVELVICIAILALLAGAALPAVAGYLNSRARTTTHAELERLGAATLEYFRDVRALPGSLAALETGTGIANWSGPYMTSSALDAASGLPSAQVDGWSQPYDLAAASSSRLVLTSRGSDRAAGTSDDIALVVDVVPVRRELSLERLRTINQAVRAYNAQYLTSAPLSATWSSALARLVATGYLPNDPNLASDGFGSAFVADPAGLAPVVRFKSSHVAGS